MTTSPTELVRRAERLVESHGRALDDTDAWLRDPDGEPDRSVREVVVREREVTHLVDYLSDRDRCPDELRDGLDRIRARNEAFREEYPDEYRDRLESELGALVDRYPTVARSAFELDPLDVELDHDFEIRDSIEMVRSTLPDERIPDETVAKIDATDDVLRCKCEAHANEYREIRSVVERPHYPKRYWWRHPDEVLTEA